MIRSLPTFFLSHGGGPWTHMKDQLGSTYDALAAALADIPRQLGARPRAILIVSAHWEADAFTLMTAATPPMIYDYRGFPPHTYRIRYDAPGAPEVATRAATLLQAADLPIAMDSERGFDHGAFVPLFAIHPQADVPVLQLSILRSYDPATHFAAGRALAPLRREGVLIVGSGLSYHNLRAMGPAAREPSKAFDDWLHETLCTHDTAARRARLLEWERAPAARLAHPEEDHLVPLFVVVGAAEDSVAHRIHHEDDFFGGVAVSSYRFGEAITAGAVAA